jgi:hypothetical protein
MNCCQVPIDTLASAETNSGARRCLLLTNNAACANGTHTKIAITIAFVTMLLLLEHVINRNEFKHAILPLVCKQCSMHGWQTQMVMVLVSTL